MTLAVCVVFAVVAIGWGTFISVNNVRASRWVSNAGFGFGSPWFVRIIGVIQIALGIAVLLFGIVATVTNSWV